MLCLLGKLMDRDYRILADRHGFVINRDRGDDLIDFPIEKARLRSIWYLVVVAAVSIVGYGWTVQTRTVYAPFISSEKF